MPPKLKHCLTIWVEPLAITRGNPIGMANIVTSDFSPLIKPKNKSKKTSIPDSPDCSGKPGMKKGSFSCRKRATEGSSFFGLEKQLFE